VTAKRLGAFGSVGNDDPEVPAAEEDAGGTLVVSVVEVFTAGAGTKATGKVEEVGSDVGSTGVADANAKVGGADIADPNAIPNAGVEGIDPILKLNPEPPDDGPKNMPAVDDSAAGEALLLATDDPVVVVTTGLKAR